MARTHVRILEDPESLRGLVRNLRYGIYISTLEGDFLDANPAFLEMFGVASVEELRAAHPEEVFVDPEAFRRERALLTEGGGVREFEMDVRRPTGEVRTVLDTSHLFRDAETGDVLAHGILIDITERKRVEARLREESVRDPLTGCYNRRFLSEWARIAEDGDGSWGCIIIDVDHFKRVNDELGHDAGDRILIALSRFLMRRTRAAEAVVRLGGDEFLLLLPQTDAIGTGAVADRLRLAAAHEDVAPFSLGLAARQGNEPVQATIERADHLLLKVKSAERAPRRRTVELRA